MIHNVIVAWPEYNIISDLGITEVQGDTIVLNITVDQLDLSMYKIDAYLYNSNNFIVLKNLLAGGSDAEIVAIGTESGMSAFRVLIAADETDNFDKYGILEVRIEDDLGRRFTIIHQKIIFIDSEVNETI